MSLAPRLTYTEPKIVYCDKLTNGNIVTVQFLKVDSKELNCSARLGETRLTLFQQCKYFQQIDFNFSGTAPALHATELPSFPRKIWK